MKSEAFIKEEFNESCNFDVDDAITKLEKLGLVSRVSPLLYLSSNQNVPLNMFS